jgi:hypothetical protein
MGIVPGFWWIRVDFILVAERIIVEMIKIKLVKVVVPVKVIAPIIMVEKAIEL